MFKRVAGRVISLLLIVTLILAITTIFYINKTRNISDSLKIEQTNNQTMISSLNNEIVEQDQIINDLNDKICEQDKQIKKQNTNAYVVSDVDRELLARVLYREKGAHSTWESRIYIISIIFNRLDSGIWNKSVNSQKSPIYNIIYAKNQFSVAHKLYKTTPTEEDYEAVDYVIKNGSQLPSNIMYFCSTSIYQRFGRVKYTQTGGTTFCY